MLLEQQGHFVRRGTYHMLEKNVSSGRRIIPKDVSDCGWNDGSLAQEERIQTPQLRRFLSICLWCLGV